MFRGIKNLELQTQGEIAKCFCRVIKQTQSASAVADHFAIEMKHAAATRTGQPPVLERRCRPIEKRTETVLGLRTNNSIRIGQDIGAEAVSRPARESDAGEHRIW